MKRNITFFSLIYVSFYLAVASYAGMNKHLEESLAIIEPMANACVEDMEQFCNNVAPLVDHMVDCLKENSKNLSGNCKAALSNADPSLREIAAEMAKAVNACILDVSKLCQHIKPGGGRYLNCLNENSSKVSRECMDALDKAGYQ